MKMKFAFLTIALGLLIAPMTLQAQSKADKEAVKMAVLDYVEGIYLVQPERIERSVSKDLAKIGYWRAEDKTTYQETPMNYQQLYDLAGKWNAKGRVDPETAPKKIELLDVMDQTAVAKLSAEWGYDYLNLAKKDGRWMIVNVLWQSYPADMN